MIESLEKEPHELFAFLFKVMRAEGDLKDARARDRLAAAQELLVRKYGKPVETQLLIDASRAQTDAASLPEGLLGDLARALLPRATVLQRVEGGEDAQIEPASAQTPEGTAE